MGSNVMLKYDVDIVMCIDATGSMRPTLNMVKGQALSLYDDLKEKMESLDNPKYVDELRVRIIAFRDYLADGEDAMLASDFFSLPAEAAEFRALVESIEPQGGGDAPEDGLEALAYAMKSKWKPEGSNKRRQIIVVWSDEGTHEIGFGRSAPNYPARMPSNFAELTSWWGISKQEPGVMGWDAKRLLIYAPADDWWTTVAENWNNVLLYPSEAGKGLDKLTYDEILSAIAQSV